MNLKEAKTCVRENIKGYKLQRTNDILSKYGLHGTLSIYTAFASSIAMLPPTSFPATVMGMAIFGGSFIVANSYYDHELSHELKYLNNVKDDLSVGQNYYENVSRDEFEKILAKRRTFLRK